MYKIIDNGAFRGHTLIGVFTYLLKILYTKNLGCQEENN